MKRAAIVKAEKKLAKAKAAKEAIANSQNFNQLESAWDDFLISINAIHMALNAGHFGNARTRQWCGNKAAIARKDELLAYIRHARNEDQHGLEPSVEHVSGSIGINPVGGSGRIHIKSDAEGNVIVMPDSAPLQIFQTFAHPKLVPVTDSRDNNTYAVPSSHLGTPIQNQSPLNIASLACVYYQGILKEVEAYVID